MIPEERIIEYGETSFYSLSEIRSSLELLPNVGEGMFSVILDFASTRKFSLFQVCQFLKECNDNFEQEINSVPPLHFYTQYEMLSPSTRNYIEFTSLLR